jgi:phosphonate transport system permease protein
VTCLTPSGRPKPSTIWTIFVTGAVLVFTAPLLEFDGPRFLSNLGSFADFLRNLIRMPDLGYCPKLARLILETVMMALVSTVAALAVGLPLSLLAARNTTPWPPLRAFLQVSLAIGRGVPDLLWALMLVSAVGLGVLPGVAALIITSVAFIVKVYAEALEVVDTKAIEGLAAVGAGPIGLRTVAVVPQAAPDLIGLGFYLLDVNVRAASILGLVGAGGIGFDLSQALRLFQYERLGMILFSIYALVTLIDRLSEWLRSRLVS